MPAPDNAHGTTSRRHSREVNDLLAILDTQPEVKDGETVSIRDVPWYAEELQRICNLSIEHTLPVIFYG